MKKLVLSLSIIINASLAFSQVVLDQTLAPFYHGVASGDPTPSGVIIWTRVTDTASTIPVTWRVATDTGFANIVASGSVVATSAHDYCVKVDVQGLNANKWYFYQFRALNKYSLTGRTKTLPLATATNVDSVRFAVVSCANYESGFFNAYEAIKQRNDVDAVVMLGDYIYEYGQGEYDYNTTAQRHIDPPWEAITQADYRARHSQVKLDPELRHMHQQYPVICVWDDHEVADNGWVGGALNHDSTSDGSWAVRKAAALSTYIDWMPIRLPDPTGDPYRIYRQFTFGKLIDLYMLDTRYQGRTVQVSLSSSALNDTARTIMGIPQRNWLFNNFNTSTRTWQVIGQQVMMAPLQAFGIPVNNDQWDGYPADRNRLYASMQQNSSKNFAVLSGDIHSGWADDLPLSGYGIFNRNKSAGVEFIGTSVTSPYGNPISGGLISLFNSHVRYQNPAKGYLLVNITKKKMQGEYYAVSTINSSNPAASYADGWFVNTGEKYLRHASGATVRGASRIFAQAPGVPMISTHLRLAEEATPANETLVVLGVYPNPVVDNLQVQFYTEKDLPVNISLYDIMGRKVFDRDLGTYSQGLHLSSIETSRLINGTYSLVVQTPEGRMTKTLIKEN